MRRKIKLCMSLLLLLAMIIASKKLSELAVSTTVSSEKTVVVIDAGHGGEDPGKVGVNGLLEKDLNLQIAQKLKDKLQENGIEVVMTRQDDVVPENKLDDMKERVSLINDVKPMIAVSIHQNSYSDSSVKGAQVFYYSESEEGKRAALLMQQELKQMDMENIRESKADSTFYMLKKTEVPTIIVECGFLSNPLEAEKLAKEDYQMELADTICAGVIKWLDNYSK